MMKRQAYLGIDIGSISTKGVIIDEKNKILASAYIWTEGDPIGASKKLLHLLEEQFDKEHYQITAAGTTGSARKLVGAMIGAGTGAFLSSQSKRLGIDVEDFGEIALHSQRPARIAARCTVFAESDLVHKIQMGYAKEDIVAGLCQAVAENYLNNVGKGKKILSPVVFQGGVSKNAGVVSAMKKALGCDILVDENGHLMGALGIAILAGRSGSIQEFDFSAEHAAFQTREVNCGRCPNNCEIICVYRDGKLIDSWGNRCEKGALRAEK